MKKSIITLFKSAGFLSPMLGLVLAVGTVSCKTTVPPNKPAATEPTQPLSSNQPAKETESSKFGKMGYYTCGMHTEVRSLDPDGKCPLCGMALLPAESVDVIDPASGKTNTAATFPVVSGYYSCPMHWTVLSKDSDDKCPICGMALVPVESPVFGRGK